MKTINKVKLIKMVFLRKFVLYKKLLRSIVYVLQKTKLTIKRKKKKKEKN